MGADIENIATNTIPD